MQPLKNPQETGDQQVGNSITSFPSPGPTLRCQLPSLPPRKELVAPLVPRARRMGDPSPPFVDYCLGCPLFFPQKCDGLSTASPSGLGLRTALLPPPKTPRIPASPRKAGEARAGSPPLPPARGQTDPSAGLRGAPLTRRVATHTHTRTSVGPRPRQPRGGSSSPSPTRKARREDLP